MTKSKTSGENSGESHGRPSGDDRDLVTLSGSSPAAATDSSEAALSTQESGDGEPAPSVADEFDVLARGATIGRYLVLERIGAGAMGVVYAAYDPELDRKIALKLLRPQGKAADLSRRQARMVREAKAIAKLSHPNVVGIFDVGVHEGQVFMAMEHLAGGTLRDWSAAKKRTWRETVQLFIAIGHGLAGAHAEGLVHRDFKPDNVLLDKNGVPKVVDFGLVRLAVSAAELGGSGAFERDTEEAAAPTEPPSGPSDAGSLTRTGALTGTPAYMAPEQFRSEGVDARSDQFAFCVALYEALYGERPFAGDNILALADGVLRGRVREAPKESQVPGWVRRVVVRGLSTDPSGRHPAMEDLLRDLQIDPVARTKRRVSVLAASLLVVLAVVAVQRRAERRQRALEREIAERVLEADRAMALARAGSASALTLRAKAFEGFDQGRNEDGERAWGAFLAATASVDESLEQAEQATQAAVALDHDRSSMSERLGDILYQRALLAETEFRRADVKRHVAHMLEVDRTGRLRQRWQQPGDLTLSTSPSGATFVLEQYVGDVTGHRRPAARFKGRTPLLGYQAEPGSYRVALTTADGRSVYYPVVVGRGERISRHVDLPAAGTVPPGYAFIPPGDFLYGEPDESLRTSFLDTVPIHKVQSDAYLIAEHEVTYQDWLDFVETLPPAERERRLPFVSTHRDYLRVLRAGPAWRLELRPTTQTFAASIGEPIVYTGRTTRKAQAWSRMPVGGISPDDIEAFLRWRSTQLPGARLCTDVEWERAARGADDRVFPHGDRLDPDDANFDLTFGRRPLAFGPDEVGSYPASVSPFGVQDMAGNVLEIVRTRVGRDEFVARGGGYYFDRRSARVTNREPADRSLRYPAFGFRVCADAAVHPKGAERR